jgi:4-hydroxy-4-methyl-2-oxoglutarate aldolase
MSASIIDRLQALDTCAVSDALDRTGLPPSVVGLRPISTSRAIAGRVVTVQLGPAEDAPPTRHLCTAAVDASGPGEVIVIANEGRVDCAGWGGLLSLAASLRGIEGVIIDGACRDVPEAAELELPVFGRAPVAVTARGRVVEKTWNQPVTVLGITVRPGDLVIADASGVAFVPQSAEADVVAAAEQIAARETAMAKALRQGAPISEVMGASYESLLSK